jgi:hypothetical protein
MTLGFQFSSSCKEFIPAGTNLSLDNSRIISSPNFFCKGATIDESAAGSLISKTNELAVRVCADINCVLSNIGFL